MGLFFYFTMNKIAHIVHWFGFIITCLMLILSYLDQSRDEVFIHIVSSMIPNTLAWVIGTLLAGKRKFLPFLYN